MLAFVLKQNKLEIISVVIGMTLASLYCYTRATKPKLGGSWNFSFCIFQQKRCVKEKAIFQIAGRVQSCEKVLRIHKSCSKFYILQICIFNHTHMVHQSIFKMHYSYNCNRIVSWTSGFSSVCNKTPCLFCFKQLTWHGCEMNVRYKCVRLPSAGFNLNYFH